MHKKHREMSQLKEPETSHLQVRAPAGKNSTSRQLPELPRPHLDFFQMTEELRLHEESHRWALFARSCLWWRRREKSLHCKTPRSCLSPLGVRDTHTHTHTHTHTQYSNTPGTGNLNNTGLPIFLTQINSIVLPLCNWNIKQKCINSEKK